MKTIKVENVMVEQLIQDILSLSGNKILTLAYEGNTRSFDVSEEGVIGYEENHLLLFKAKIISAMHSGGGLVVRQFTKIMYNDRIPYKNIYAVYLHDDSYHWLPKKSVEDIHCIDANTGKKLPLEKAVRCLDFPN